MPNGLFRGLAKAAIDGYVEAKIAQHQAARQVNDTHIPANPQPSSYEARSTEHPHANTRETRPEPANPQPSSYEARNTEHPHANTRETRPEPTDPNACPGLVGRCGGVWYKSALLPDLDVCAPCYASLIRETSFSGHFHLLDFPPATPNKACDMATSSARALWADAVAQAGVVDAEMLLRAFGEKVQALHSELVQLVVQAERLQVEIRNLDTRVKMTQCQSVMQFGRAWGMGSTEATQYPYASWYGAPPSMYASQQASATGWSAVGIAQERDWKAEELRRVVERVREIV